MANINYTGNKIEANCRVSRVRFYNEENNFGIVDFNVVENLGKHHLAEFFLITCKGRMNRPVPDTIYTIKADEIEDPKWGLQYQIVSMYAPVDMTKPENVDNFMLQVLTERELEATYAVFDNSYEIWDQGDVKELTKIKGIGMKTAVDKAAKFQKAKAFLKVYVELADFNLTDNMLNKLKDAYGENPDLIISVVKDNPYVMAQDVYGVGFKTCDRIALEGGMDFNDPKRIAAYIRHYLNECAQDGLSWITTDHLLGGIIDNLGEEVTDQAIAEAIHNIDKELWYNEEHTQIGLKRFYNVEYKIAEELYRLAKADSNVRNGNWMDAVKKLERLNRWEFTDEQLKAVEIGMNNNVLVLTGLAGTGKSSSVQAIVNALPSHRLAQTALSGRAASRLKEITGKEGQTIHRLLGFPLGEAKYNGFAYNQETKLDVDIVIVDEVSMISGDLFYALIRAIPEGSKLIILGDTGQLPAIGNANVLNDIIASGEIPAINLTKIHRQAAKSAIITESIKVRHGEQLIPKEWVGIETRGELQDLNIECFSDKSNTFYQTVQRFNKEMAKPDFNIMDCQVITPIRSRGDSCTNKLNATMQEIYNPYERGKSECKLFRDGQMVVFRVGDKVINTQNNYSTENTDGVRCPVYNGSIGTIKKIYGDGSIVVDFAYIGEVVLSKGGKKGDERAGLELGYAITVHKFQGSQARTVIFALDFNSYSLLSKELIYTAITRAEKMCYMICQTNALRYGTAQNAIANKQTFLQGCLHDVFHPKLVF